MIKAPSLLLAALLAAPSAPAKIADEIHRSDVGGIDVLTLKTGVKDVVTVRGLMSGGGSVVASDRPMLAELTGAMLDKGTTKQDKFAIASALEGVGASLRFLVGADALEISGRCLAKDLPMLVELLAEQLRSPAFSEEEFEKVKKQEIAEIRQAMDDTAAVAVEAFTRAVYPLGHPNRILPAEERIKAIETITLDEVKTFHAASYGVASMKLVFVGDVDAQALMKRLGESFAGSPRGLSAEGRFPHGDAVGDQTILMPDKTNVSVAWGMATSLKYSDPDTLALRVGSEVLGGGFTARLMGTVRDKEGLTYGIGAGISGDDSWNGAWRIRANFSPELLDKGIASTRRELLKWWNEGITAEELAARKSDMAGSYKVGLSTTGGMASAILDALRRGYDLTWVDEYPAKIQELTLDQVNAAIRTHLDPGKMVIIKAGTVKE
jgi:zinc protease